MIRIDGVREAPVPVRKAACSTLGLDEPLARGDVADAIEQAASAPTRTMPAASSAHGRK
ncbi:hypothetical protein [Cupriavidus sp. YAF13]|uniref:hypothetical protein n=1 Tax=Cupriavidus sp. YAF13 TaxID=3233075 RepID=UPI003F93C3E0